MRAVFGSLSGPITISATTAMTTISEKPMSNMRVCAAAFDVAPAGAHGAAPTPDAERATDVFSFLTSPSIVVPAICCGGASAALLRGVGLGLGALHAFLEALHRAAQVLPDVAQLLRAEDQHDDQQYDQPVPDAQSTHVVLLDLVQRCSAAASARADPGRR